VLPGHRLAKEGKGVEALRVCAFSAVISAILSLLVLPLALFLYPIAYGMVKGALGFLLLIAVAVFILQEKEAGGYRVTSKIRTIIDLFCANKAYIAEGLIKGEWD
jgi:TctA family transporter